MNDNIRFHPAAESEYIKAYVFDQPEIEFLKEG